MKTTLIFAAVVSTMLTLASADDIIRTLASGPKSWNLPSMKDAMLGKDSKAYYKGTTEDVIALAELFSKSKTFFAKASFWEAFIASMQVDITNFNSECIEELDNYF